MSCRAEEAIVDRCGDTDLGAEGVAHARLAFGDSVEVRLMQGINLATALFGLVQQMRDQPQCVEYRFPEGACRSEVYLTRQVAYDPLGLPLQCSQSLAHEHSDQLVQPVAVLCAHRSDAVEAWPPAQVPRCWLSICIHS